MKKNPKPEAKGNDIVSIPVQLSADFAKAILDKSAGANPNAAPVLPAVAFGQEIACWAAVTKETLRDALARVGGAA